MRITIAVDDSVVLYERLGLNWMVSVNRNGVQSAKKTLT